MRRNLPILLVCLAALYYLAAGTYKASHFSADFIPVYGGARCIAVGCNSYDPFNPPERLAEAIRARGNPARMRPLALLYPPSTLLVLSPLCLLPFPVAAVLWALLGGTLLLAAIGLVLSACPRDYFWVASILACVFLVGDSPSLLGTGNPATFACALAVAGAMLFLRNRHIPLAVLLLTVSLATKPQIAGFIVLYFLVRKIHWRSAALSMGASVTILLAACLILQARPVSRDWLPMLRAKIAESVQPGQVDDPTPANVKYLDLVNLQTITGSFVSNPKIYNAVAWAIFLALVAIWIFAVRATDAGRMDHFFALPPLLVLTLLPVYHRGCDDLLLILALPMILRVMQRHRVLGGVTAAATALPHILDVVMPRITYLIGRFWNMQDVLKHKVLFILLLRHQCLVLLLLFGLYVAAMYAVQTAPDTLNVKEPSQTSSV
jgi:Glycosyltransferase family 87